MIVLARSRRYRIPAVEAAVQHALRDAVTVEGRPRPRRVFRPLHGPPPAPRGTARSARRRPRRHARLGRRLAWGGFSQASRGSFFMGRRRARHRRLEGTEVTMTPGLLAKPARP